MQSLATLLDTACDASPASEAVVGLEARTDWAGWLTASAAIASRLADAGVAPGDRVAVACLKDLQSYVAVHAILRAGAVVVPIDPLAPAAVAHDVLIDAAVSAVVGDARTIDAIDPWNVDGLDLRAVMRPGASSEDRTLDWDGIIAGGGPIASPADVDLDDPAYIIYTSGSTGRPKGIVHTHGSALAYAERAVATYGLDEHDRVAGIPPLHFDQSTFELYAAPLARAAVVAVSEAQVRFPATFTQWSADERITVWYSVPSLFRQLVERGGLEERDLGSLRHVLYGGEPYPGGALADLHDALPHVTVTNVYGPAEVNECTNHRVSFPVEVSGETPIGRPWHGVDVLVVDDDGAEAPEGELWVAGPTMMREYWQRPDLTARSIVERSGRRWYRTGDLVSVDDDGVLWFRGRRDNQIKLRGVRLELEAIEGVVGDAPGIAEAVVGPDPTNGHLEAVVMLRDGDELDLTAVRHFCAERLAAVATPRRFHVRDRLPSTPSGKIDRTSVRSMLKADEPECAADEDTVQRPHPQEHVS
ncbi:MAG: AMP-binding protein [Actinomycetota bacterium]